MSFTVAQILAAARRNPELVTSETAAYMVLSLTEQSLSGPRRICAEHVLLHPGGAITIGDVQACASHENATRLRGLLRDLLECSAPATASEALGQVAFGDADGPTALRTELQKALVPLNRGAARRALARLYRKLSNLISPTQADVGSDVDREAESSVSRRSKRRSVSSIADESPTFDIPVAVDETAFRVVSSAHRQLRVDTRTSTPPPRTDANWHPAQTTPWQFHDRPPVAGEGTPILGSMAVRLRDHDPNERRVPDVNRASRPEPNIDGLEAAKRVNAWTPAEVPATSAIEQWVDTFVDAPAVVACESTEASPTFNPRRSRVAELVQRLPSQPTGIEAARKSLLEMVNAAGEDSEFNAPGTVTPPPVAHAKYPAPVHATPRGPRRIVLSSFAAVLAGVAAWLMFGPDRREDVVHTVAASPDCEVPVRVDVPAAAKVFLNDAKERLAQSGPVARFEGVKCAGQADVTVQLPSPDGSPLPDAWVRMPLPEVELRAAFEQGRPFVVAPLGEHK